MEENNEKKHTRLKIIFNKIMSILGSSVDGNYPTREDISIDTIASLVRLSNQIQQTSEMLSAMQDTLFSSVMSICSNPLIKRNINVEIKQTHTGTHTQN